MHNKVSRAPRIPAFALALALSATCVFAQSGPEVTYDVQHDVSPPLRDLINDITVTDGVSQRMIPVRPTLPDSSQGQVDSVIQAMSGAPSSATPGLNFDGIGQGVFGFSVSSAPPDTEGAIGATQYVQWENTSFAVFNKTTGALIAGPSAGNKIWSGFAGQCSVTNDGVPIAQYDKVANRWVLTQFSLSPQFFQCVAVSTSSDATGTYNRYAFKMSNFPDYPKLGVWPDAYYISFNMFSGNNFVGADACALDKNAMLNGLPATSVCFQQNASVDSLLPSDQDGVTPPPAGTPDFFVDFSTNSLRLWKFHVDFAIPANSTFTGPTTLGVAAFNQLCGGGTCVPQLGTTQQVDSLGDRLMYRLAYRNFGTHDALVTNHSVTAGASGGVRWYEIRNPATAPAVFQQSTFAPDTTFRWMGSVAMDNAGNMGLGYSASSSTIHPGIRFTGRLSTDALNTLQAEDTIINGTGSQNGGLSRWGDYSAMTVDPVNDCTFWYTQQYLKASGSFNWNTRIATFTFPACTAVGPFNLSVATFGTGTGSISSAPAGITCGLTCNASFSSGAMVTLTATPASGSTFTGWSGACSGTGTCTVTMSAAQSVVATFAGGGANFALTVTEAGTGTGTVTSSPTGINCPTTCTANFASGTVVTLTATPTGGATFFGWSGACSGNGACAVTMSAAKSVTATFNAGGGNFTLTAADAGTGTGTITSLPSGINCGTTCSASFASGTVVKLTATAGTGDKFAGWSGACSGNAKTCSVTMNAAKSVTATFSPFSVRLTVTKSGAGTGTVTSSPAGISCGTKCNANFPDASSVTLTATPSGSSTFGGWSGACSGTNPVCTLTMSGPQSATAAFN